MSDWQNKSNQEINMAVEKLTGVYCEDVSGKYVPTCDYCNNPSDAWPIILESQISILNSDNDLWSAQRWVSDKRISHEFVRGKNALRAAMIVYLEMNGVKP